jgi:hypothetical protein
MPSTGVEVQPAVLYPSTAHNASRTSQQPQPASSQHAHLPSPTLALRCSLNDSRQIQQLDLCVIVVDDAGNARERCELVCSCFRLCASKDGQQGGLADRREACKRKQQVYYLIHTHDLHISSAGELRSCRRDLEYV